MNGHILNLNKNISAIKFRPSPKNSDETWEDYHVRMMQECSDWFANKLHVSWLITGTRLTRYTHYTRFDGVRITLRLSDHPMDYFKARRNERKLSFCPLISINELCIAINTFQGNKPKELIKQKFRFY